MILDERVDVIVNSNNIKHLKNVGYFDLNVKDVINMPINLLSKGSHSLIRVKCDICGDEKKIAYKDYMKNFTRYGFYTCSQKCSRIKSKKTCENFTDEKKQYNQAKKEKTCLEKYKVSSYSKTEEFQKKIQKTCLEKYNVKNIFQLEWVKEKSKEYKKNNEKEILKKREEYNKNKYKEIYSTYDILNVERDILTLKCNKCNSNYEITKTSFYNRIKYNVELCSICNPINIFNSDTQRKIYEFIKENYNGIIIENDKTILKPKHLDIYLPELKLAFEYNGLWCHDERFATKDYHLNKSDGCEKQCIQLIHIWEDDWLYKQDIVKSMILNKLDKTLNKIFARKCEIKEVDSKISTKFLEENHIQGKNNAKINLGLYFNDELVSLMTFGKKRLFMKSSSNDGEYELLRFCNKLSTNVVGGASRLFKYFINNYNPKEITTYADRSYSNGNLYTHLGFSFVHKTEPNYYYIIDGIRKHRFGFRKDVLVKQGFDKNKTEHEIMLERKIYQIYNAGNLKFIYNKNNQ